MAYRKVEEVYPITTKVHPDGNAEVYITPSDIESHTPPKDMDSFNRFMTGQTMYMEGYYPGDVEQWLNNRPNLD